MLEAQVDRRKDLCDIQDQGVFPTCLSYATSTVHRKDKNLDDHLSAEVLHYNASQDDFNTGVDMNEIQEALHYSGQPKRQHCETLTKENRSEWSPPDNVNYYTSASIIKDATPELVRELILECKLPVLGISITDEFHDPEAPWVFSAGSVEAYHAVVGVGLGEFEGEPVVLIRNSWGEDWADSGHAWLDNSFLNKHLEELLLVNWSDDQ